MPAFQDAKNQADQEVMVNLLTRLSEDPTATQRSLASEMGVALGMMSNYMKSCMRKGYVRAQQVAPRRWAYFVTPKGFTEKSRMVVGHLSHAMTFFRDTRIQLDALFSKCQKDDICKIALVGESDVAEVAELVARGTKIQLKLMSQESDFSEFDGVLVTDVQDPQGVYDALKDRVEEAKLLTIPVLCIARKRIKTVAQLER